MKRILLVNKSFALGGIETALNNMTSNLVDSYKIDLLLFYPEGPLKNGLPSNVNIIKPSMYVEALGMPFVYCLKHGSFRQKIFRLFATIWTKLFSNRFPIKLALKYQAKLSGYDLAIAYHHETDKHTVTSGFTRLIDNCVEADRKVAWIHYDPDKVSFDESYNEPFYLKMDKIVCVSNSVKSKFVDKHPLLADKTIVCYNFLNYERIYNLSDMNYDIGFSSVNINLFSACRLTPEKGIPRAIIATSEIFRRNTYLKWYIAGDGKEREEIERIIHEEKLEKSIFLIGHVDNPYVYIRNADVLMVVSYHEAAPMVYLEAKAFDTCILSTEISSAREILTDKEKHIICENSSEGIIRALNLIIRNKAKIKEYRKRVIQRRNNAIQLKQISSIFEE